MIKKLQPIALWLATLIAVASVMLFFEADLLWKVQQHNVFLSTSSFFQQMMAVPGGMLSYLGAWFTQHFYYPWVGVIMLCGWWLLLMWLMKRAFNIPDLWMLDLQTGEVRNMEEINSPDTESYHSWSSNGRWVMFSSRRYDANYTRPFIAHIDANGRGSKPFELPCANPDYHRQLLKSYNVPEFMRGPVTITPQKFADVLKQEGIPVKYVSNLSR